MVCKHCPCLQICYVMTCRPIILCLLSCITGTVQVTEGRMLVNPASDNRSGLGVYGVLCLVSLENRNPVFKSHSRYGYILGYVFVRGDRSPSKKYFQMSPKKIHKSRKRDVLGCTTLYSHLDIEVICGLSNVSQCRTNESRLM